MSEITKKEIDCIKGNILAEDRLSFCFTFSLIVDGNCIIRAPTNFSNYLKVIQGCQEMKRIQDSTADPSASKTSPLNILYAIELKPTLEHQYD